MTLRIPEHHEMNEFYYFRLCWCLCTFLLLLPSPSSAMLMFHIRCCVCSFFFFFRVIFLFSILCFCSAIVHFFLCAFNSANSICSPLELKERVSWRIHIYFVCFVCVESFFFLLLRYIHFLFRFFFLLS